MKEVVAAASSAAALSLIDLTDHRDGMQASGKNVDGTVAAALTCDSLSRPVYCLLGLPIDAVGMPDVVRQIEEAARTRTPLFLSTINVNFLTTSATNAEFRESVLRSDLCLADGMPIVWIARILGIPIRERVAGSDLFAALKADRSKTLPLKLFLFGGAQGVAAAAAKALNDAGDRVRCVGSLYPGFGGIEDMSKDSVVETINTAGADILAVALGAVKGQTWLWRNHHRLRPPVRTHLGAALNFAAGTVKRAPPILRRLGLEWLWRIKQEPHLWRRYWHDGAVILSLFVTRTLPLALTERSRRRTAAPQRFGLAKAENDEIVTLRLSGFATESYVTEAIAALRVAVASNKQVVIDLTKASFIDCRFFGLLLMLRKELEDAGKHLKFIGVSSKVARLFRLHGVEFLLA